MDCNDGIGNDSLGSNSQIEYDDDMLSPCLDQGSGQGRCQGLVVAPESQEHNSDPDNADADGDSTIICATSELTELHESESEAIDLEHMELFESNAVDVEIPTGRGPGTYACISCCSLTELLDTVAVVNEDLAEQVNQGRKRKREQLEQYERLQADEWTGEFDEPDKGGGPQTPSDNDWSESEFQPFSSSIGSDSDSESEGVLIDLESEESVGDVA